MKNDAFKRIFSKIYPIVLLYHWIKKIIFSHKFKQDFDTFKHISSQTKPRFSIKWSDRYPCLNDATTSTGFDRHYVFHTAWAGEEYWQ